MRDYPEWLLRALWTHYRGMNELVYKKSVPKCIHMRKQKGNRYIGFLFQLNKNFQTIAGKY